MEWIDEFGKETTSIPPHIDGFAGFVYYIYYTDGSFYIGQKTVRSLRKKKLNKAEMLARPRKNSKDYKMVMTTHKWRNYEGSSKYSTGKTIQAKRIVTWLPTKRALTYVEASMLFKVDALFDPKCLNANILGKFHRNVLDFEEEL